MQKMNPYLRLMRLYQPVGIWLVFWPCAWAIMLADTNLFHPDLLVIFLVGAVLTRGAGCIVNDMADREFDKQVERTKARPLASGELSMQQASIFLAFLTLCAAVLLFSLLPIAAFYWTLPSILLIVAYPFMKRITWWPQAFLGITFNWGVFIAWVSVAGEVTFATFLLYIACVFWTLGYDTIYGYQDKKDDEKIGIKSTSRRLAGHTKRWVSGFYGLMLVLFGITLHLSVDPFNTDIYLWGWLLLALHFAWQIWRLDAHSPANCLKIFKSNGWAGALPLLPAAIVLIAYF